jgi:hypothetical protein
MRSVPGKGLHQRAVRLGWPRDNRDRPRAIRTTRPPCRHALAPLDRDLDIKNCHQVT